MNYKNFVCLDTLVTASWSGEKILKKILLVIKLQISQNDFFFNPEIFQKLEIDKIGELKKIVCLDTLVTWPPVGREKNKSSLYVIRLA